MSSIDFIRVMKRDIDPKTAIIIEAKRKEYGVLMPFDFDIEMKCIYKEKSGCKAFIKQFVGMTAPGYYLINVGKRGKNLFIDHLKDDVVVRHIYNDKEGLLQDEIKKYPKVIQKMFDEIYETEQLIYTPFGLCDDVKINTFDHNKALMGAIKTDLNKN